MFARRTFSLLCSLFALTVAGAASAAEVSDTSSVAENAGKEAPAPSLTMALLAGSGFNPSFKTGFGASLGYTLQSRVYFGASFLYHFGTSTGPVQSQAWFAGPEVGYELRAGAMRIRPYAGFGQLSSTLTVTMPPIGNNLGERLTASDARFAFWPGASFVLPFEDGAAFVGLDTKLVLVDQAQVFNAYGTFGLAF